MNLTFSLFHTMCSAVLSFVAIPANPLVFLHIGHFVMSSGHSYGAIEAGASQYLIVKKINDFIYIYNPNVKL